MAPKPPDGVERERFEALWNSHQREVYAYALRRLGDEHAANDAVSESFVVAWRRLDDVPEQALPWLLGVARRVVANQFRSERRRNALFARITEDPPAVAEDPNESSTEAVGRAFNRLSPADREVLSMIVWEGLRVGKAAQVLGISAARFSVRLHRAKKRLRDEMNRADGLVRSSNEAGVEAATDNRSIAQMEART